jgi:alanine-synthesizing transaminase
MQEKFYLTELLPPYVFAAIYDLKKQVAAAGMEIIDFGMGNPDSAPPKHVMEKMVKYSADPKTYGYAPSGGIDDLKKALCGYYKRRFNVDLDYKSESLITIGAKEGITSLATAISDDKNYIIVPNPSYPIHTFAFTISKSRVIHIDALSGQMFLEKFKEYVSKTAHKPAAVIVNYPCNPTTGIVGLDFYQELVDFCKANKIYIISDIAYAEIYFDEKYKPHSILEIEGAKDIAIEFSSVSKSYSMAGCRVGFAVGNKNLIAALSKIKSYLDYGSFAPIQLAAIDALSEKSDSYLEELRKKYHRRALFLSNLLNEELEWNVEIPKASMFLWAKIPEKFSHLTSFEFCKELLLQTGVALSPGTSFGSNGNGYVRISLIHDEENMIKATAKIKEFFNQNLIMSKPFRQIETEMEAFS